MSIERTELDPEFLNEYLTLTSEHITKSELLLIELEKNPNDTQLIDELFRIYHSIKGDSSVLGITSVQKIAHEIESLMDRLRSREFELEPGLIDLLLASKTEIKNQLQAIHENTSLPEIEPVLLALQNYNPATSLTNTRMTAANSSPESNPDSAMANQPNPAMDASQPDNPESSMPSSSIDQSSAPGQTILTTRPVTPPADHPEDQNSEPLNRSGTDSKQTTKADLESAPLDSYTIFRVADLCCTVSVQEGYEVIHQPPITRLPNVADYISGVINHQGRIIPVINLQKRLQLNSSPVNHDPKVLILNHEQMHIGLLVDEVMAVDAFRPSDIFIPKDGSLHLHRTLIRGAVRRQNAIILILNLTQILDRQA